MMFGKKKRIAELEAKNARQADVITQLIEVNQDLRNQVEYLVRTIRQMDDQIWQMSQCTDWHQMRPYFVTLSDGMTARKVAESNRISDVLRPQLIETYKPPADGSDYPLSPRQISKFSK
jgi:uncharacterized coiled-coil protein SlyX